LHNETQGAGALEFGRLQATKMVSFLNTPFLKHMRFIVSKRFSSISLLAFAFYMGSTFASAQNVDVFFGAGTALNTSANTSFDTFGTGIPFTSPKLGGAFGKVGGDFMLTKHFGVGAETDFRFAQDDYLGLKTRPIFYDFNGIYMPTLGRFSRIVPEFQAGLGGAKMNFSYSATSCDPIGGCSTSTSVVESSSHFQVHMAAGLRFYATRHLFVRPQVDLRYVPNFFQYGRNWVPEYSGSLGWSFGER
jgi:hypothetical protein